MRRVLVTVAASLILLLVATACGELGELDEDKVVVEAVAYFERNYPDKSDTWVLCAANLFSQAMKTESDIRLFNEDDEYKTFTLNGIAEACDPVDAQ